MNELIISDDVQRSPAILRPLVKPDELIEAQNEITQLIVKALKKDTDYGQVPGTRGKETLFKPGAERILKAFGCHVKYVVTEREVDHDRINNYEKMVWSERLRRKEPVEGTSRGLYRYVIECQVYTHAGAFVGSGIGSCSTLETKYIDRPRDLENTVLKMAQKRAMVAAVLNTFGLSDRFTQDMEETVDRPDKTVEVPETAQRPLGYDPQNRKMQSWLMDQLKKKKVPEHRWDDVGNALSGRPSTDLDNVLSQVIDA